jgi:hypothetical protein
MYLVGTSKFGVHQKGETARLCGSASGGEPLGFLSMLQMLEKRFPPAAMVAIVSTHEFGELRGDR